jgi:hypothetical protein
VESIALIAASARSERDTESVRRAAAGRGTAGGARGRPASRGCRPLSGREGGADDAIASPRGGSASAQSASWSEKSVVFNGR